jgi:8-oxo-dGTP diphosphatase
LYTYNHPRPSVTVDVAIFRPIDGLFQVLLIKRAQDPFQDCYALPGGFIEMEESLEQAAARELTEETSLMDIHLVQVGTFSEPDRDPRGRVITTAFAGMFIDDQTPEITAGDDAIELGWFNLHQLPDLAFDHLQIIQAAAKELGLEKHL